MNKYLYYQDFHIKHKNPHSRVDEFYTSCIIKFKEILSIAKEKQVDAIIDGGDFWDIPIVSNTLVDEVLDLIEETNIPLYLMYGNHNMISHHKETSGESSTTHMLRRSKILRDANDIIEKSHVIKFIDYNHAIEEKIKDEGIFFDNIPKWKIGIVHAMLTDKAFLPTVLHVQAKDVTTNADLILVGHYHQPWKVQSGKTTFLDIGCIGRSSIAESEIEPSVLYLDFSKKIENISEAYEIIKLKSAKPGSEVFNLDARMELKNNEKEMAQFIDSLRDFKAQDLDLRGAIEYIGKENKVERPVIDRILEKLLEMKK